MRNETIGGSYYKQILGSSDYAALSLTGCDEHGQLVARILPFGADAAYKCTIYTAQDEEPPAYYKHVYTFTHWVNIYDDDGIVLRVYACEDGGESGEPIKIYRAGELSYAIVSRGATYQI